MPAKKHIHKYENRTVGTGTLWCCSLFNCNHHMPKHMEALMKGRASICWECEIPFSLDEITMSNPRPVCKPCLGLESEEDKVFNPAQIAIRMQELKNQVQRIPDTEPKIIKAVRREGNYRILTDGDGNETKELIEPIVTDSGLDIRE